MKTMNSTKKEKITVETFIKAPREIVWKLWTQPEDIIQWNHASDHWHTPLAKNELRPGGTFTFRMEAKDGSSGFDFNGIYDKIRAQEVISYTIEDGRKVDVHFTGKGTKTKVVETFEAEDQNPIELQRNGWQAILNNFKEYTETKLRIK